MPRVHVEVDFVKRVFPRDVVDVDLHVSLVGRSSASFGFVVRSGEDVAARGTVVAAFVEPGGV